MLSQREVAGYNQRHDVILVYESQRIDHAYHEDKLLLLTARRAKLRADSDQIQKLDIEISATTDLVRSYRIVKALGR